MPRNQPYFSSDKGTEGYNIRRLPRFSQRSGHGHPEVDIQDMRVPATQILGDVGQGFELTKDWFVEARLAIAARSIGMAIRATELANEWANERQQFGRKIIDFQAVEFMIAEMGEPISWPARACCIRVGRRNRRRPGTQTGPCQGQRHQTVLFGGRLAGRRQGGPDLRRPGHHV